MNSKMTSDVMRAPVRLLKDETAAPAYLLALLLALVCVCYMYTPQFLAGDAAMFLQGDAAQHVSGWRFYRDDDWHFPLLHTQRMNSPEGVSIAFTDSIPLMALLLKPFRAWLPENFHYIGLWHAVVYILQSQAAVYLIRALGARSVFAAAMAAGFALTWPALLMRFGHTSLLTHALILFSFGLYFNAHGQRLSFSAAGCGHLLVLCLAMMTHPYLLAMCYAIFLALLFDQALMQKAWRVALLLLVASLVSIASLAFILGYLGSSVQTAGFGLYSMNLLAPLCGGRFWYCNYDGTGSQAFEGYNYFGAGVLALFVVVIGRYRADVIQTLCRYPALCAMLLVLTLYSFSNRIFLSSHLLFEYPLPSIVQKLADTFRCSGRFFWVVGYLLLFAALARLLKEPTSILLRVFLVLALLLQFYDTKPARDLVRDAINRPAVSQPIDWSRLLQDVDDIEVYPVYGCGNAYPDFQLRYQSVAALYHKRINTGYIARASNQCEQKEAGFETELLARRLYVVPADRTGGFQYLPRGFFSAVAKRECVAFEKDMLCVPGWNADALARLHSALQPVVALQSATTLELSPASLPTLVGRKEGDALVAQPGKPGYLSFGPYLNIAAGHYGVTLKFDSKPCSSARVGSWDAVAQRGSIDLARGDIGAGQTIVQGNFTAQSELKNVEIRTQYEGVCDIRLLGITLIKLQ